MTTRTFIFCDICNPRALRNISVGPENEGNNTKLHALFEGHAHQAARLGWVSTENGHNLCPRCAIKKYHERYKEQ